MNVQSNVKATHTVEQKWSNVMRKGQCTCLASLLGKNIYVHNYVRIFKMFKIKST